MSNTVTTLAPGFVHSYFSTRELDLSAQLLAWHGRVTHVTLGGLDAPLSRAGVANGFHGATSRYSVNGMVFMDTHTDALRLERSIARISTDNLRYFIFYAVVEGGFGSLQSLHRKQEADARARGISVMDMDQPFRAFRPDSRGFTLFAPRDLVAAALPDAQSLHGRTIQHNTPLFRLIYEHLVALNQDMPSLSASQAEHALSVAIHLMVAAFGKQAKLSGNARAAVRAAMFARVRRYIDANLYYPKLSPDAVQNAMQLPRRTLFRLFEHEGGIEAFIRHRRLHEAAAELVKFPHLAVADVAYGLGFKSHQDFSRAFRRAFDMTAQDLRAQASVL